MKPLLKACKARLLPHLKTVRKKQKWNTESYEAFAKGLQSEIAATLKDRPQKAEVEYFVGKVVKNEKEEDHRLTEEDAKKLNKLLYKNDVIDEDDKITPEGRELIEQNKMKMTK